MNWTRTLIAGRTNSTTIQCIRYTVVGGCAFVVDFATLWGLTEWLSIHYLVSAAIAFLLGLATNYYLSVIWVFSDRVVQNRPAEFIAFGLLGIIGLGLNELSMYVFTGVVGYHYLASKICASGLTFVWNFVSRKILLFSNSSPLRGESCPELSA